MARALFILGALWVLLAQTSFAVPAEDGDVVWSRGCQAGQLADSFGRADWICLTPDADADDEVASPIVDATMCENVDIWLFNDFDGDGTSCTVTWDIEMCPPGAAELTTDALKNTACADSPGVIDLTGDDIESDIALPFFRVVGNNAGANIDSCRIVAKCAERAEQ